MRLLLRPWCWLVGHARRFVFVERGRVWLICERCGATVRAKADD